MSRYPAATQDREAAMSLRPKLLDVCCGAGGAAAGYARAGFEVTGVDIVPQPDFPFEFIRGDALEVLADREFVSRFDAVHGSPPCQLWATATLSQRKASKEYPDLITPLRKLLEASGLPWVMENVPQAPLRADVGLCGCMFGLELEGVGQLRRERVFELSWKPAIEPLPHNHTMHAISIAGHGTPSWARKTTGHITVADWRKVMGIAWVRRREALTEAIPPVYTEHVGGLLMSELQRRGGGDVQLPPYDWPALFAMANHRPPVQHADALEWLGELEPGSAKVIVFDPPYSRSTPVRSRDDGAAGRVFAPFSFMHKALTLCARALRPDGVVLLFGDAQLLPDLAYFASLCGLHYYSKFFWDRGRPGSGTMFRSSCDEVVVVAKGIPDVIDRAAVPNIIRTEAGGRRPHPYYKPPEVYAHAFRRVCRRADLVVDPFCGSASSRDAALDLGCRWLGRISTPSTQRQQRKEKEALSNDDDEYVVELDLPGIPPDLFAGMIVADVRAVTQGRGGSKPLDGMEALGTMCREHMAVVILELAQRVARLEDLYGAGG